jgi:3-phosphoshikimate 1-carboxyvinyltransferase
MIAACFAKGKTVIEGIEELRVKETDRVNSMVENLTKMGARIRVEKSTAAERIVIAGGLRSFKAAKVSSFADHRTAMSLIIAGLKAQGSIRVDNVDCIKKSFPDFLDILRESLKCS